jgi:valyl-tRNA synthetase
MTTELASQYTPKEVEERWYQLWESRGYFKARPDSGRPPFCLVIPPPNVTGSLHMGHALNGTLQDLIARYRRMKGDDVLWVPGCDHAGIATHNVVERELAKEGLKRQDLGREKFVDRVWEWKNKYGATIMRQLRRLGSSCDWSHERFTMDEGLSRAVAEAFVRLHDAGLIYRKNYVVNWCPRCGTAISDIEVDHKESNGKLYHVRYPVAGKPGSFVTVATTRPETMFGDTAVAVNPADKRYVPFHGAKLVLPLAGREIPLLADAYVDAAFGTGALKITPAHDANDFQIGEKFGLEKLVIMDTKGVLNEKAGAYQGLDRFEARKRVVADLEKEGLLAKVEDYTHAVGRCSRCSTVIEPYLSLQWFVRMKDMALKARKASDDKTTTFMPENWTKVYTDWLDGIKDWCISRQLWWGHRIPIYYDRQGRSAAGHTADEAAAKLKVPVAELTQDPDVLDTWFSSALWPFSTLGWPDATADLKRYFPTSVLVSGWDILIIWISKMSMFSLELAGKVPFDKVLINSLVADEHGQKMTKSKGNVIDPLSQIDTIGADALRYSLCIIESQSRYISLAADRLELGRNFMNKIWNAARFMLMNLQGISGEPGTLPPQASRNLADRWILSRLEQTRAGVEEAFEKGWHVNAAASSLLDFFWHDLCDWYIEASKTRLQSSGPERLVCQQVLAHVLEKTLRLLHPVCPFITEEIWQQLPHRGESIMLAPWPEAGTVDAQALEQFKVLQDTVYAIRNLRAEKKVDAVKVITALLKVSNPEAGRVLAEQQAVLEMLTRTKVKEQGPSVARPQASASAVAGPVEVFLPLADLLDMDKERQRQAGEIERQRQFIASAQKKLANPQFKDKAPAAVVDAERQKIKNAEEALLKLQSALKELEQAR